MLLTCSKKKVDFVLYLNGIFVPYGTGHMPIDFLQMMKYNHYKRVKIETLIKSPFQLERD
jgi:hypothetical protein